GACVEQQRPHPELDRVAHGREEGCRLVETEGARGPRQEPATPVVADDLDRHSGIVAAASGGRKRSILLYRRAFEGGCMRLRVLSALVALFVAWVWIEGRAQSGGPVVSGAHRFERVADGIYYATASGTMNVGANSPIIVTDDETLVIDSEITPAAARA